MTSILELIKPFHPSSEHSKLFLHEGMVDYTRYVVESRAIPSMKDGLKPVHRIAIWCIEDVFKGKKTKVIGLAGSMLASGLYAHGDSSANGAILSMAKPYTNNEPLFLGHGSFGTRVDPNSTGAPRYVSVSSSKFLQDTILVDKELYEMIPSIDGDAEICRSFLPLLPTVLLNGTSGMAIGYSTNILPHAASELKAAVVKKLRGETIENIKPNWKMYDCNVFDTDRELSYWVQGKVLIENTTTVRIVSLNPELSLEKLKEHLIWMQNEGHIVDFEDNTTSEIDITVKMKRADLAGKSEHDLVQLFKLSCRQTERLVVIGVDEKVKVYKDHDSLIGDWVDWRFTYYKRRFERLLGLASEKLSYLQDVIKVYEAGITSKLKDFQSKAEIDAFIEQVTGNKRPQISSFPTYRWTKESIDAIQAEIGELLLEITSHEYMIENESARRDLFIAEVEQCC